MPDRKTLDIYDAAPGDFAKAWLDQPPPADLQDAARRFFIRDGATADIGSGSGRDVAWLNDNGYPTIGYDISPGLLAEARRRYPQYRFETAALPALAEIADASFDNVVCETVIMHLPLAEIAPSVKRLTAILKPGGILYLSWRATSERDQRDEHGRLYTMFAPELVRREFANHEILLEDEMASTSSGKLIHRVVVRKLPED